MRIEKAYIQIFNEFDPILKWWKSRCPLFFFYQILLTLWISAQRKLLQCKDKIIYTSWDMTLQIINISDLKWRQFLPICKCDFFPSSYCFLNISATRTVSKSAWTGQFENALTSKELCIQVMVGIIQMYLYILSHTLIEI